MLTAYLARSRTTERKDIIGKIQGEKHDLLGHLRGLKALNQRINQVDRERIRKLETEIGELDEVSYRPDRTYEEQEAAIRNHVEGEVVDELESIEKLMDPFDGSEVREYVRTLIDGDFLTLSEVDDDEVADLQESKLGPHLKLKLERE